MKITNDSPDYDLDAFSPPEIGLADFEYLLQEKLMDTDIRLYNTSYAWGRIKHYNSTDFDTLTSYYPGLEMRLHYTFTDELSLRVIYFSKYPTGD